MIKSSNVHDIYDNNWRQGHGLFHFYKLVEKVKVLIVLMDCSIVGG